MNEIAQRFWSHDPIVVTVCVCEHEVATETAVTEELKQVQSANWDYIQVTTPWWPCFSLNPTEYIVTHMSKVHC